MIDLHTHILPGIDDGARDPDEALAMLRLAAEDGITTIVATPHAHHSEGADVPGAVAALNDLARTASIPMRVLPGSEVRIASGLIERYRRGQLQTINGGRYLLLELPLHDDWPEPQLLRVVDGLLDEGVVPILAHAERYRFVERDPQRLVPLIERGVPVQVNARSLLYREADPDRQTADRLFALGYVHLLASDAHNVGYRAPKLRSAYERAATLAGASWVTAAQAMARAIVEDEAIDGPDLARIQRASPVHRIR